MAVKSDANGPVSIDAGAPGMLCSRRLRVAGMPGSYRHKRLRRRCAPALALLVVALAFPSAADALVVKDNLFGVKTIAPAEAWAVGNFGSIYYTKDGGKRWELRESGTRVPLFGVDFADAQHGWIVGKSSTILATTDGGKTWKAQKSVIPDDKHLFNVHVVDANTVWVVGDWGAIAVTHDGGATWQDRSLDEDVVLYDLSFPDAQHGFISGEFGTVLSTSDGGETWSQQKLEAGKTLFGIGFSTPEKGWAVGIDGLVVRTRDGAKTWEVQRGRAGMEDLEALGFMETLKNPALYDVQFAGQYGVIVGDTGMILTSADGGETWTARTLPEKQRLVWMRAASLVPGTHGFVVGSGGFAATLDHDQVTLPNTVADTAETP